MGSCLVKEEDDSTSVPKKPSSSSRKTFPSPQSNSGSMNGRKINANSSSPNINRDYSSEVILPLEERKRKGLECKTRGNEFFKQKDYQKAIAEYTKAIKFYDQDSTYFSNRAMCYRFLKEWVKADKDSDASINLNPRNYKAYNLKGISCTERAKQSTSQELIQQAVILFNKALDIYKQENGNNNDATSEDLSTKLAKAKKIEWLLQKETKLAEYNSLQTYLKDLITKDTNVDVNAKDQQIDIMNRCIKDKKNEFATPEIPEHFTCKISFELMKDPIITPDGIGYERIIITEHLKKNGPTDPITRRQLKQNDVIENKALKRAIETFSSNNPWAFDFLMADENFADVDI